MKTNLMLIYNDVPAWEPWIPPYWGNVAKDIRYWDGIHCRFTRPWMVKYIDPDITFTMLMDTKFLTDGGSIPKFAWGLIDPYGVGIAAWFIHDAFYGCQYLPRDVSDLIMYRLLRYVGMSKFRAWAAYTAVDTFGRQAYKNCAKRLSSTGELIMNVDVGNRTIETPDYRRLHSKFEINRLGGEFSKLSSLYTITNEENSTIQFPAIITP